MKANSFLYNILPNFAALAFVCCNTANGQGQVAQTRNSTKPDAQSARLPYTIGTGGLNSLAFNGQSLLPQTENGLLRVAADPVFRGANGEGYTFPSDTPVRTTLDNSRPNLL